MLYFIRHGESQANVDKIVAGRTYPAPLTQKGRDQAKTAGEHIMEQQLTIDHLIASPVARAKETALIIARVINFDPSRIQYDGRLTEYDMGPFTGKSTQSDPAAEIINSPDTEDPQTFQDRVMDCYGQAEALPGNTLLVSHDYIARIIEATRLGMEPKDFYRLKAYPNAHLVELG